MNGGRHFIDDRIKDPDYDAAVAALRKVRHEHQSRAAAEVLRGRYLLAADEKFGQRVARGEIWWGRLVGFTRARALCAGYETVLPGEDHPELRKKDGVLRFFFHPYGLTAQTLTALGVHCQRFGLDFSIDAWSWYFPGWTVLVVIEKKPQLPKRG